MKQSDKQNKAKLDKARKKLELQEQEKFKQEFEKQEAEKNKLEAVYLELEELAMTMNFFDEASFLHGALVGILVVNPLDFSLIETFFTQLAQVSELKPAQKAFLEDLRTQNLAALQDLDLVFNTLIVPNFYTCAERFNSISAWFRGFLRGIDKAGVNVNLASQDLKIFLHTALEISEQTHTEESLPNDDKNKEDLNLLEDFLKLGVLSAYTDWVMQNPKD